jgi:predicted GIY-YIG superfamily endonuclease
MKKHYVYELINLYGTVEYVGESKNPYRRFRQHTKSKYEPKRSMGIFYGRQDLILNVVSEYDNYKDALNLEAKLKSNYGFPLTEKLGKIKGGSIGGKIGGGSIAKRPILQFDKTNTLIKRYESVSQAARELNIPNSSLTDCAKGRRKQTRGFIWKYETN